MKLHEIITTNADGKNSILIEKLLPYKKLLLRYYTAVYNCEPFLLVTDVMNAAQYALIVPINEIHEAIDIYYEGCSFTDEEREQENEILFAQSILLKNL